MDQSTVSEPVLPLWLFSILPMLPKRYAFFPFPFSIYASSLSFRQVGSSDLSFSGAPLYCDIFLQVTNRCISAVHFKRHLLYNYSRWGIIEKDNYKVQTPLEVTSLYTQGTSGISIPCGFRFHGIVKSIIYILILFFLSQVFYFFYYLHFKILNNILLNS